MKLLRYETEAGARIGAIKGEAVVEISAVSPSAPSTIRALLEAGPDALNSLAKALSAYEGDGVPLNSVKLLAPIPDPRKFLGIGFNYQSHVDEVRAKGHPIPDLTNQVWFNKQTSCVSGPVDPIHLPTISEQLDYEGELAIVIGRRCRHVGKGDARKVIAGYMICNDVSVRDWQLKAPTATLGKSFDTHGPTGPWLTTADEVSDPENLTIKTWVDEDLRQDGNTSELVNRLDDMIAYLSAIFTLEPGDILSTGSPCGVGAARTPPLYLKAGQTVRIEIQGLGALENTVVPEPLELTTFMD